MLLDLNTCFPLSENTPKACIKACNSGKKYYARGLCTSCYQKEQRLKHGDKYRAYDRIRQKTDKRRQQDRDRHRRHKDKRNAQCRKYRATHLKQLQAYDRSRWLNPSRKAAHKKYTENNRERIRKLDRAGYYRNKAAHIARILERRLAKINATPKWLSKEDKLKIAEFYRNRPVGYHVDHIIPLQGKDVRGLHVPWNLQYLPAAENIRKGNKCD